MKNQKTWPALSKHLILFINSLLFSCLLMGGSKAFAEPSQSNGIIIGTLTESKQNAEILVKILLMNYKDEDNKNVYSEGIRRYGFARAGFNGWIACLITEIESGNIEEFSTKCVDLQKETKTKGYKFIEFVESKVINSKKDSDRGPAADALKKLFSKINNVLSSIKRELTNGTYSEPLAIGRFGTAIPTRRLLITAAK